MYLKKESWKLFDQIHLSYDKINQILSFGQDQRWRRLVAKNLPKTPALKLLDLASGTADQLIACMESKAPIASAIGVDLSEKMLAIANKKIAEKPYRDKVRFLRADATNLPFEKESFDAISCSFGIRNVEDPSKTLQEIFRLLRKGGKALILEFSLPPFPIRPFALFYLRTLLPRIGGLLSKNRPAYSYLNKTIETFPSGGAFSSLMEKAGFNSLKRLSLALGAVTLYTGEKR